MKIILLFLLLCVNHWCNAQLNTSYHTDKTDIDSVSPYQFKYKKLIIPSVFIGYGILSLKSDALKQLNNSTRVEINEHRPDHIRLDNYSQFAPAALVYGLNAIGIRGKHKLKERSIILGTSILLSSAIVTPTKHLVQEYRPDSSNRLSFPSGHTAMAFATAQFMFREYHEQDFWLSLVGYPFAVFTGVYRTLNDKHWVGDVAAGAGIGILSTEAAYWLFPKINTVFAKSNLGERAVIYPFYQGKSVGIGFSSYF